MIRAVAQEGNKSA